MLSSKHIFCRSACKVLGVHVKACAQAFEVCVLTIYEKEKTLPHKLDSLRQLPSVAGAESQPPHLTTVDYGVERSQAGERSQVGGRIQVGERSQLVAGKLKKKHCLCKITLQLLIKNVIDIACLPKDGF